MSALTTEGAIHLRLIELNAELAARRRYELNNQQIIECRVLETKIKALNETLVDVKRD